MLGIYSIQACGVSVPPHGLSAALGGLLTSGRDADVTLACEDGEQVAAHAVILSARSTVLAALLQHAAMRDAVSSRGAPPAAARAA